MTAKAVIYSSFCINEGHETAGGASGVTVQGENTGTGGERFELHLWEEAFHFIENEIGLIGIPQVTSMETAHLQRGSGRESHITDIEAAALPQQGKKAADKTTFCRSVRWCSE